jgi:hypothetical protein
MSTGNKKVYPELTPEERERRREYQKSLNWDRFKLTAIMFGLVLLCIASWSIAAYINMQCSTVSCDTSIYLLSNTCIVMGGLLGLTALGVLIMIGNL